MLVKVYVLKLADGVEADLVAMRERTALMV